LLIVVVTPILLAGSFLAIKGHFQMQAAELRLKKNEVKELAALEALEKLNREGKTITSEANTEAEWLTRLSNDLSHEVTRRKKEMQFGFMLIGVGLSVIVAFFSIGWVVGGFKPNA
jgi:hypothetical protein